MIFHLKDAGAVRTDLEHPGLFRCAWCGTTWSSKLDLWSESAIGPDVPADQLVAEDPRAILALEPVRDPMLPDEGVVVERKRSRVEPAP